MRASIIILLFSSIITFQLQAQETPKRSVFHENFIDSTDNALDFSAWLSKTYGFFPIVSLITEPAVGYGAGGGLIFLHQNIIEAKKYEKPPDLSMLVGLYTENGTWGTGIIHRGFTKWDKIRYSGILFYTNANLAVYREPIFEQGLQKLNFNLQGLFFNPSILFRLGKSRSFLGATYLYSQSDVSFGSLEIDTLDISPTLELKLSGLGALYNFDTRDNVFTPNKGLFFYTSFNAYNELWGSNFNYSRLDSYFLFFSDHFKKLTLGLRLEFRSAFGDPPFISKPFLTLRGVPAFRYQGDQIVVFETEERWDFSRRWSLVGFAGAGRGFSSSEIEIFQKEEWGYSVGAGVRYLIAKDFNIYTGLDVARGPEQWAFYIQFGHYWNGL